MSSKHCKAVNALLLFCATLAGKTLLLSTASGFSTWALRLVSSFSLKLVARQPLMTQASAPTLNSIWTSTRLLLFFKRPKKTTIKRETLDRVALTQPWPSLVSCNSTCLKCARIPKCLKSISLTWVFPLLSLAFRFTPVISSGTLERKEVR